MQTPVQRGHMNAPKNSNLPTKILVVDDDSTVGQSLEKPFKGYNIEVAKAKDFASALTLFEEENYSVVLVELEFEPTNGLVLIQRFRNNLKQEKRASGMVLLTGNSRKPSDEAMIKELGDIESLVKPLKPINVLPVISRAYAKHNLLMEYERFREKVLTEFAKGTDLKSLTDAVKQKFPEYGVRAFELLMELHLAAGSHDQALHTINNLLAKEPNNTLYLSAKGQFSLLAGKTEDALFALEAAHKIAPLGLDRMALLEDAYLKNREAKKALEIMELRVQFINGNLDAKFGMANKLQNAGEDEVAKGFVRKHASPAEVVRYYNNKGVAMSQNGDCKGAIIEYQRALAFFPSSKENFRIHYNIALARLKLRTTEDLNSAVGSLKKCLELAPDFEKAKSALEQVQNQGKKAS